MNIFIYIENYIINMKMTSLEQYISESLTKTQRMLVGSIVIDMLRGSKLTPDQLNAMFSNLDLKIIADIENYISSTDKENSMPYMADKDDFLVNSKAEKIIDNLCKYFTTYVV